MQVQTDGFTSAQSVPKRPENASWRQAVPGDQNGRNPSSQAISCHLPETPATPLRPRGGSSPLIRITVYAGDVAATRRAFITLSTTSAMATLGTASVQKSTSEPATAPSEMSAAPVHGERARANASFE